LFTGQFLIILVEKNVFATILFVFTTGFPMPRSRRVALKLDLKWPLKRHALIFAGTQRYADEHGWESIIDEYAAENLAERTTKRTSPPYDGLIGRVNSKLGECARRLRIPLVNVWFNSPACDQLPGVFPDMAAAGRLQAEHLLGRGLRRFAVLTCEDRWQQMEAATFRATVAQDGCECIVEKVPLDPSRSFSAWSKTEQRIESWMEHWQLPIGAAICTEEAGRLVVQLCRRRGWRVPGDVAILAGTNEETLCVHPRPSLSSVEMGYERIGYEAARLLDQLMHERETGRRPKGANRKPQHILLPPQGVVVRESTDFYAVEDELVSRALQFIAANSHRDINVEDVARALEMHPRTLQRRFSAVFKWPISDEIRRVRIERAKRELTQSKRSVAEIARVVGFGSRMRLYDAFRCEVGVTPMAYRKQRRMTSPQ
jgi:LacI family transcriptional regulator